MKLFKNIIFFFKTTRYKIKWYFIRRKVIKRNKIPNHSKDLAKYAANATRQFSDGYKAYKQQNCKQTKK